MKDFSSRGSICSTDAFSLVFISIFFGVRPLPSSRSVASASSRYLLGWVHNDQCGCPGASSWSLKSPQISSNLLRRCLRGTIWVTSSPLQSSQTVLFGAPSNASRSPQILSNLRKSPSGDFILTPDVALTSLYTCPTVYHMDIGGRCSFGCSLLRKSLDGDHSSEAATCASHRRRYTRAFHRSQGAGLGKLVWTWSGFAEKVSCPKLRLMRECPL